jgi:hypothetical protein
MSDNHGGAQAPHLPSPDWYLLTRIGHLSLQTPSLTRLADATTWNDSTPDPEFNEYANKQSAMVNAGLDFDGTTRTDGGEAVSDTTASNPNMTESAPVVDFDFRISAVMCPTTNPGVDALVRVLLSPPPHAFLYGVLSIQWVLGAIGQAHFDFRITDERYVLKPKSEVRTQGQRLGLPNIYLEWLCGDEEGESPTEQGMFLTPQYFEETRQEMEGDSDE